MYYLVDTNVLSEPSKPQPNVAVLEWVDSRPPGSTAVSAVSLGEVQKGIELLEHGQRRVWLQQWFTATLHERYGDRVLPVTQDVALTWGRLTAVDQKRGRVLKLADGLLLATADVYRLTIVTRNARDFEDRGVRVINPWAATE